MTARIIMKLRVAAARLATADVLHLTLVHPSRPKLPAWEPGAHVDLRLPDGKIRQYSLCGDPQDLRTYEIAIKREDAGRGASRWAHEALVEGAIAHVSAPRNNFPIRDASRHLFVLGGIGVTPGLAMARRLRADGAEIAVHFCARTAAEAPLLTELSEACGDRLSTWFSGEGARFDAASVGPYSQGAALYVCGPHRLYEAVRDAALALGWPETAIHAEAFQAPVDENFKPEPFDATLASSGATLHVPADRSLLDVLREHGKIMPSSCELGVCGSCVCGYTEGVVIHRDAVISTADRQDRIAPCVSRARVSVTLDL
ncbi:PDR/VanB family oxidoreductase [Chenggangzhangella methanolivorans]|uniref:PDR/VanB family oxidoreductase n=1 Tax=Chenggangzhangella methanolivorans TaxID=1437009 RepID=A0A9E6RCK4_9HYPH|nr:PDR/VanB family oxidoreductase [Chenggangzhangella methanolivorans]QZO01782.1 PDR/VanB family oxidoreductase [Chenggangzhangella methanolivorans]